MHDEETCIMDRGSGISSKPKLINHINRRTMKCLKF